MFDSVLRKGELTGRSNAGTLLSVLLHVGLVAVLLRLATTPEAPPLLPTVHVGHPVIFAEPRPAAPPLPRGHTSAARVPQKPAGKPDLVQPTAVPAPAIELAPALAPAELDDAFDEGGSDEGTADGRPGGVAHGTAEGVPGGRGIGVAAPAPVAVASAPAPVEFTDEMTRPRMLSGPPLAYSEKALEREVEGQMIVKCVVTTEGIVRACRVLKGLAFMDSLVVQNLLARRYSPALFRGRPIAVDYTFKINMTLPR